MYASRFGCKSSHVAGVSICGELSHAVYRTGKCNARVRGCAETRGVGELPVRTRRASDPFARRQLAQAEDLEYPVYNDQSVFTGDYYSVASFATRQTKRSIDCPYPPCLNHVQRPDPRLGTINSFESAATSIYNGFTVLLKGQLGKQVFIRAGYTLAKALDDGTDSLVWDVRATCRTRMRCRWSGGLSVTDQRNRFIAPAVYEPASFQYELPLLNALFNNWKVSSVITLGSGRPINATMAGDANRDDNTYNHRPPAWPAMHTSARDISPPTCG